MGTMAKFTETGAEPKDIVIFDYNQDRGVVWAYNFKSRKSQMVICKYLTLYILSLNEKCFKI